MRSRWDGGALPAHSPLPLGWWKLATGFSNETLPAPLPRSLRAPHRTLATYPHLIPAGSTTSGRPLRANSRHTLHASMSKLSALQHCRVFTNNDLGQRISHQKKSYRCTVPPSPTRAIFTIRFTNYLELPKGHRL